MKGLIFNGKDCILLFSASEDICIFVLGLMPEPCDIITKCIVYHCSILLVLKIFLSIELSWVSSDIS